MAHQLRDPIEVAELEDPRPELTRRRGNLPRVWLTRPADQEAAVIEVLVRELHGDTDHVEAWAGDAASTASSFSAAAPASPRVPVRAVTPSAADAQRSRVSRALRCAGMAL